MMLSSVCGVCAVTREASTLCIYASTPQFTVGLNEELRLCKRVLSLRELNLQQRRIKIGYVYIHLLTLIIYF